MRAVVAVWFLWTASLVGSCSSGGAGEIPDVSGEEFRAPEDLHRLDVSDHQPDEGGQDRGGQDQGEQVETDLEMIEETVCVPQCDLRVCGPDGCGGVCGGCGFGLICTHGGVCAPAAAPPVPGDLVVTEIMINPAAVPDKDGEWVEVRNVTGGTISLNGLEIRDEGSDGFTVDTEIHVGPGKHVVFGARPEMALNGGVSVDVVWKDFQLANDEDEVVLRYQGVVLDRVAWGTGWTIPEGASLSLAPNRHRPEENNDPADWCPATLPILDPQGDLGTPGVVNPDCAGESCVKVCEGKQCGPDGCGGTCGNCVPGVECFSGQCVDGFEVPGPGDLVIAELMVDPKVVGDAAGEYIELWNATPWKLNLAGMRIRDAEVDSFEVTASLMAQAFGYVVLGKNGDPTMNGGVSLDYVYSGFILANNEDEVILERDGELIDQVFYRNDTWPMTPGRAMVLDSWKGTAETNDFPEFWCLASSSLPMGDKGSPGQENGVCPQFVAVLDPQR
jgi:hypothetical protein